MQGTSHIRFRSLLAAIAILLLVAAVTWLNLVPRDKRISVTSQGNTYTHIWRLGWPAVVGAQMRTVKDGKVVSRMSTGAQPLANGNEVWLDPKLQRLNVLLCVLFVLPSILVAISWARHGTIVQFGMRQMFLWTAVGAVSVLVFANARDPVGLIVRIPIMFATVCLFIVITVAIQRSWRALGKLVWPKRRNRSRE